MCARKAGRLLLKMMLLVAGASLLALVFIAYLQPGLLLDFSNLLSCG